MYLDSETTKRKTSIVDYHPNVVPELIGKALRIGSTPGFSRDMQENDAKVSAFLTRSSYLGA